MRRVPEASEHGRHVRIAGPGRRALQFGQPMGAPVAGLVESDGVVAGVPDLKLQILNCPIPATGEALVPLARAGQVFFDFAMQESVGAIARLVDRVGAERVLYGSHFPLFHAESSMLKVKEAALAADVEKAVRGGNARMLQPKTD